MTIDCFSSPGTKMSPIQDTSLILHSRSARKSLQSYYLFVDSTTVAFLKSCQVFFRPDNIDFTTLPLLIEVIESTENIGHVH